MQSAFNHQAEACGVPDPKLTAVLFIRDFQSRNGQLLERVWQLPELMLLRWFCLMEEFGCLEEQVRPTFWKRLKWLKQERAPSQELVPDRTCFNLFWGIAPLLSTVQRLSWLEDFLRQSTITIRKRRSTISARRSGWPSPGRVLEQGWTVLASTLTSEGKQKSLLLEVGTMLPYKTLVI